MKIYLVHYQKLEDFKRSFLQFMELSFQSYFQLYFIRKSLNFLENKTMKSSNYFLMKTLVKWTKKSKI